MDVNAEAFKHLRRLTLKEKIEHLKQNLREKNLLKEKEKQKKQEENGFRWYTMVRNT